MNETIELFATDGARATLQQQGADLRGEAGIGYVLQPGDTLPPLTLPPEEIDALVLGLRWVASRTDPALAEAARDALARIGHALPADRRLQLQTSFLRPIPGSRTEPPMAMATSVMCRTDSACGLPGLSSTTLSDRVAASAAVPLQPAAA